MPCPASPTLLLLRAAGSGAAETERGGRKGAHLLLGRARLGLRPAPGVEPARAARRKAAIKQGLYSVAIPRGSWTGTKNAAFQSPRSFGRSKARFRRRVSAGTLLRMLGRPCRRLGLEIGIRVVDSAERTARRPATPSRRNVTCADLPEGPVLGA